MMNRRWLPLLCLAAWPARAQEQSPVDFLRALYAAHLPALQPGSRRTGVLGRDARPRWFAPELASRMARLGADPVANGNDPDVQDLRIAGVAPEEVEAVFTAHGTPMRLRYALVRGAAGWRVRDIRYPDGRTLRGDLGLSP